MKIYWTYNQKIKSRRPYFQALAKQLGYQYVEKDVDRISTFLKDLVIFKKSRPHKRVNNIVQHEQEDPLENIYFFDYHYVVSTGSATAIFEQTIFFAQSKYLELPEFELKPKSRFNRVADYFGKKRKDLIHPFLSKNYLLETDSPKVLEWVNNDEFISILKRHPKLTIDGANYQLVIFKNKKMAKVEELSDLFSDYHLLYNQLKSKQRQSNL